VGRFYQWNGSTRLGPFVYPANFLKDASWFSSIPAKRLQSSDPAATGLNHGHAVALNQSASPVSGICVDNSQRVVEDLVMAEAATKLPVKPAEKTAERAPALWRPFETLRREIDRLFDDLSAPTRRSIFDIEPFWWRESIWGAVPAVDIAEKDGAYEVTAELPGLDEKDIEVKLTNGSLVIRGEKKEEKEEKKKDYYLAERRYGSFERRFQVPPGVDTSKIDASFKKGVLTVTLPKTPEAKAAEKKIAVKSG
jgi:HSP20 family protein